MVRSLVVAAMLPLLAPAVPAAAAEVYDDCDFAIGDEIGGAVLPNRPLYTMTVTAYTSCLPYGDGRDDEWSVYACTASVVPTGVNLFAPVIGRGTNEDGPENPCWAETTPTYVTCEPGIPTRGIAAGFADGLAYSEPQVVISDRELSENRLFCGSPI